MAPEQALGTATTVSVDIYALGAVLYCTLTGKAPFVGPDIQALLRRVATERPLPPRQDRPQIPQDLECICLKCLEKDPRDRYASAQELADDLQCFLDHRPIRARPFSPLERGWRWMQRNRQASFWAAAVVVAMTAALSAWGTAWHFAQTAETSRHLSALADLRRQLSEQLQTTTWSDADIARLDALASELHVLDHTEGEPASQLVGQSLVRHIRAQLQAPSLAADERRRDLERCLSILAVRDLRAADELEQQYRDRLTRPENVVHVSAVNGEGQEAFSGYRLRRDGKAVRINGRLWNAIWHSIPNCGPRLPTSWQPASSDSAREKRPSRCSSQLLGTRQPILPCPNTFKTP